MIRGFVAGSLIVGSVMAVATTLVLWGVGLKGAIPLGTASGLLNLLPFLGLIASLASPFISGAPSVQHTGNHILSSLSPFSSCMSYPRIILEGYRLDSGSSNM
jgi:hypothetical protein